jgi:hypothetical protein
LGWWVRRNRRFNRRDFTLLHHAVHPGIDFAARADIPQAQQQVGQAAQN